MQTVITSVNKLNKRETSAFFINPKGFELLEERWSTIINSVKKHTLGPEHFIIYQALRGKDWRKGFRLPKEEKLKHMIIHGHRVGVERGLNNMGKFSLQHMAKHVFGEDIVTPETLLKAVKTLDPTMESAFLLKTEIEVSEKSA